MNLRKISNETLLYILAFSLAIAVRLLNLGDFPLSDQEANWALQALEISKFETGAKPIIGPQTTYVILTGLSFFLFQSSNFLARFWPAVSGAFLVFAPYLFRQNLGRKVALILAFGLALDPGLVAVSRQAGGPMLAIGLTFLSIGFWVSKKPVPAGILAGLAILSGTPMIIGLLTGLLSWLVIRRKSKFSPIENEQMDSPTRFRVSLITLALTFFAIGTFFFRYPQGISGWAGSVIEFLAGISQPLDNTYQKMLVTSFVYQPLAWLFFLIATTRAIYQKIVRKLSPPFETYTLLVSACLALALALIYPKHSMGDLTWFSTLLWASAAIEMSRWLTGSKKPIISLLQAGLLLIFAGMFWNTLASKFHSSGATDLSLLLLQILVFLGIFALAGLSAILITYTWSWNISRTGVVLGMIIIGMLYSVSALWGATQIQPNRPVEFWSHRPGIAKLDLFLESIEDFSNWEMGRPGELNIVSTVDSPGMRWVLRNFKDVQFMSQVPTSNLPDLIITSTNQDSPVLSATYRGQDFIWKIFPGWSKSLPDDFLRWLAFRQAPQEYDQIILWARTDLFPGDQISTSSSLQD